MMIVYKSKASPLLKLLFAAAMLILLVFTLTEKSWALLSVTAVFASVTLYIFLNTYYTVYEHRLTIKSGFIFNETIDIESIRKIKRSKKSLLSGPGFSVDRLVIIYNRHDCVIISPDQKERFLEHLKGINPDIIIE